MTGRTGPGGGAGAEPARCAPIGTLAWVGSTGGLLSRRERRRLLSDLLRSQVEYVVGRLGLAFALPSGPRAQLTLERFQVPESSAARLAEEACRQWPASITHHSHRTFLWATALAAFDGIVHDAELLYVACLCHDTGLPGATPGQCFTLASASVARQQASAAGWPEQASDRLGDAITLHLNPKVRLDQGPEAHLVHAGASLDVAGIRLRHVDQVTRAAILTAHPRNGFKREFSQLWRDHSRAAPAGRANFLRRFAAFQVAIRIAPFPE